jgi:hypothetical protein
MDGYEPGMDALTRNGVPPMRQRRPLVLVALLATTSVFTVGCGSTATNHPARHGYSKSTANHRMPSGITMPDADMSETDQGGAGDAGPSQAARMVCSEEIRDAVARTFGLAQAPRSTGDWSHGVFTCRYRLPGGPLIVSVQDATNEGAGRAYYTSLRTRLTGARDIEGVESFGIPAFETPVGNVAFLKDGKTLRVDASHVAKASLPVDFSTSEAAYGVAAAVIGCWTE